jgi:tetratricopeptide (TPR) repeat protein
VKAELANNFGFVVMRTEPELAMKYFNQAVEIREIPEINDQKGIGIAHGGIGDCLSAMGDIDGARKAYLVNYDISKRNGDMQGVGRMSSMLGGLILRELASSEDEPKADKLKSAEKYYRESLAVALQQNNGISISFAMAGLINVESNSESPDLEYLLNKSISLDLNGIPDFAVDALKTAIENFCKKHPDLTDKCEQIRTNCGL